MQGTIYRRDVAQRAWPNVSTSMWGAWKIPKSHHSLRIIITLVICVLVSFLSSFSLVLAQNPPSFEISLISQTEFAIAGDPFTCTVVITNISPTPVEQVVVTVKVPTGTTLVSVKDTNPDWYNNNPYPGTKREEAIWLTPEVVVPGEVITFEMIVQPLPELADQQIVNEVYNVAAINNNSLDILTSDSPPVKVQVLPPTPTPLPTDTPALTATVPPTATYTPSSQVDAMVANPTSTPTARASVDIARTITPTPAPASSEVLLETPVSSSGFLVIVGLCALIIGIIGVIWFIKKK